MPRRVLFIGTLALSLVAAAQPQEDPVLRARAQPPVPRGIVEPPPLPPPEAHQRDTAKGKKAPAKGKTKKGKASAAKGKSPKKAPAKGKAK